MGSPGDYTDREGCKVICYHCGLVDPTTALIATGNCPRCKGFASHITNILFEKRCKCCGSNDHSLVKTVWWKNLYAFARFNCPVLKEDDSWKWLCLADGNQEFLPDASKLANTCGLCPEQVETAIGNILTHGYGRFMSPDALKKLHEEVLQHCTPQEHEQPRKMARRDPYYRTPEHSETDDKEDS